MSSMFRVFIAAQAGGMQDEKLSDVELLRIQEGPHYGVFKREQLREFVLTCHVGDEFSTGNAIIVCTQKDDVLKKHVEDFSRLMVRELEANREKNAVTAWQDCDPRILMTDIAYHNAKLAWAMKMGDVARVKEFAADVANMAMLTMEAWLHQNKANAPYVPNPKEWKPEIS